MVMVVVAVQGAHLCLFLFTHTVSSLDPDDGFPQFSSPSSLAVMFKQLCCSKPLATCQECSARLSADNVAVESLPQQFSTVFTTREIFDSFHSQGSFHCQRSFRQFLLPEQFS